MKEAVDFAKRFPLYKVEQDCILSKTGDVSVAFEVTLPEIFTLSDQEFEAFHQILVKAIKTLPNHSVLHKQDWFYERKFEADFEGSDTSFLTRASDRFFNERPFLEHKCFFIITRKPQGRKPSSPALSTLLQPNLVPKEAVTPLFMQEFLESVSQFQRILQESGFASLRRMSSAEITGEKGEVGFIEQYCYLNTEKDRPVVKDIQFDNGITIGADTCQLFTLSDVECLPALCGSRINYDRYSTDKTKFSVSFAAALGQLLSCNHIYNQYIFIDDAQKTIKKLESKRLRLQSLSSFSRENAISRDATNEFLNEAISAQRMAVKAHFNILVWSDSPAQLKDIKSQVSAALATMDAIPKQETFAAPQIFWGGIPGNAGDFPMTDTFDTFAEQASTFFNLETNYRSSISPVGIRLGDRLTGRPLHVDISDEMIKKGICTSRNKFILGPSGSGKSFFTNHMVRSYYEQGTHIVLVDVGHSYKGLCTLVNGYYFTYDEKNPIRFNPFFITGGDTLDTEKKESIKTLLLALWKKDDETFNRSEYVALSISLQMYYQRLEKNPQIFPCFNTYYEFLRDEFVQVLRQDKVKEKDFDVENFLYVLRPYYVGGEFDYLLNATENLDLLNERFIVFELDNIKDHPVLFPVTTLMIMSVFISKMRKLKGVRKMILIEEAWKAIAKEGMAEYIKYLFKTVRKFFGEAIVVTQEVEDIISSPVVKQAIINNSDVKILLDQSKYQNKFDQIQELLGLTEKEKAMVLSVNKSNDPRRKYKEVFISLGGVASKVFATEVSLEEYLAYTTEESEKVKVQEYTQRFDGDMWRAIRQLANDLRNNAA